MPELILKLRARELKRVTINKAELTIGRDPDNDVFIDNIGISRSHTKVQYRDSRFYAVDNGSSNGTFVNGSQIEEKELFDNDEIQIGKYKVIFSSSGDVNGFIPSMSSQSSASGDKKKVRNVFGTLQFSTDEIQNLLKTPDAPGAQKKVNIPKKSRPSSREDNTIIYGLIGTIALLIIVLVVLIVKG